MYKNLKLIVIKHIGKIILTIFIIVSIYFIYKVVVKNTFLTADSFNELSNALTGY